MFGMDSASREKRSAIMAAVKQSGTKPELQVRRVATRAGLRYRIAPKTLPGRPDLVFPGAKTVVFVHGCFWHRHDGCRRATTPRANAEFWGDKFSENIKRDARNISSLEDLGWCTIVIWECECSSEEKISSRIEPLLRHYKLLKKR